MKKQRKNIEIIFEGIVGLKRPVLVIDGLFLKKDCKFKIYADGKEIQNTFHVLGNHFVLEAILSKGVRQVEAYIIRDSKKELFYCSKNSFYIRLKFKIIQYIFYLNRFIKKILRMIKYIFVTIGKGIRLAWREHHFLIPISLWGKYWNAIKVKCKNIGIETPYYNPMNQRHYLKWLNNQPETVYKPLKYEPLISLIIPVYNIKRNLLEDCLNSVLNQKYTNFEICLADDCSTLKETKDCLEEYKKKDNRIRVQYRTENGHIAKATNTAIAMATGEYIAFLDDDDILTEDALYLVAEALNKDPSIDMIYTDEDKMDIYGKRCEPFFKPDFSPDTLLSFNYITHFAIYRKSIVDKIGGIDGNYNGAQDYDFVLRFTEKTKKIYHIPRITYHWRMVEGSTALSMGAKTYALESGKKAIEAALTRRKIDAEVIMPVNNLAHYIVKYHYKKEPMISILIPTRDYADTLNTCLKSIYKKTTYKNFEILVLNNSSEKKETFGLFKKYKEKYKNFRVVDADMEFNYSKINNIGAKEAKGEYIVLLNNDTEVITGDWLENMVGYAMQDHIGAVGAKLIYPDNTLQHCGVVLGIAQTASHFGVGIPKEDNGPYARYLVPYDNGAVTAACLMVSKKKFLEVKGLSEDLKVAFNDVEFNVKLLKKGYYNVCLPQVQLYHYESKSRGLDTTGEKYKRFLVESELLRKKCGEILFCDPFYNKNLSMMYPMMLDIRMEEEIRND